MKFHLSYLGFILALSAASVAGCGDQTAVNDNTAKRDPPSGKSQTDSHGHSHENDCDHVEKGPHGGQVFELGDAYHAEMVHDEKSHSLDIYLLDAQARASVSIEEPQIVINAMVEGKPATFELVAAPLSGESEGRSSHFESKDDSLFHAVVEEHDSKSRLRVSIEGKQYVTDITACKEHGHEGHEH